MVVHFKNKTTGRVEVVQDENEETNVRDEVFQVSELVEPYRVAPSIELEENSNFHVSDDSLVDVDVEELNVVLSSSGQANVDEEDDICRTRHRGGLKNYTLERMDFWHHVL